MAVSIDAFISVERSGQRQVVRLQDYLTPESAEEAERLANVWIKSLRHVEIEGRALRDRLTYRGDSLWWFVELYLHKQRTINRVFAAIHATTALIERETPEALHVVRAESGIATIVGQVARGRGIRCSEPATNPTPALLRRVASRWRAHLYAFGPMLRRIAGAAVGTTSAPPAGVDVIVFVHTAFWRRATGDDAYLGPLVGAISAAFGSRLRVVSLGPNTSFQRRTWRARLREWTSVDASDPDVPTPVQAFSSAQSLRGSRRIWRERRIMARLLLESPALRAAAHVSGVDSWELLRDDFAGLATLQFPWSARAMDEAAAALDALRPRAILTYAEAGGWGRALILEARRRGIASVGVQHGFISRHWLNYLHEADETQPSPESPTVAGFPFPTATLVYDSFEREHLIRAGRFPAESLRVVGNPRLASLAQAARALTPADLEAARRAVGLRDGQHLVLLAVKYRRQWDSTLAALVSAVSAMPDVCLAIRPHPADAPDAYERVMGDASNVRVVARSMSLVALIAASRLVVTINSTVAVEATALGVPALAMRMPNYLKPFVDAGAMAGVYASGEIAPAVARLVRDDAAHEALRSNARRFVERYGILPQGDVGERVVAVLRALMEERAG